MAGKRKDYVDVAGKLDDLLTFMKAEKDTKEKKEEKTKATKERTKATRELKGNSKELVSNTAGIFGLTASMFTLKGVMGDLRGMNSQLSKNLAQVNLAFRGGTSTLDRFNDSSTGLQQQIGAFADAVDLGMTGFSDGTLKFAAQLKAQGVDNKAAMGLMRQNTQALGLSEESMLSMTDSLVSTAAANGDSISGLISAIDSMKETMVKTTVQLGPGLAEKSQKIAAMMAQGNTALQDASVDFVQSFLNGSEGFMKAAKLGVQFTGEESLEELTSKFETILSRIGERQEGRQGAGSQFFFENQEKQFGLTSANFNLQRQIGNSIDSLVEGNTQQRQEDLSNISTEQAYMNATRNTQKVGLGVMEGIAKSINVIGGLAGGFFIGISAAMFTLIGIGTNILAAITLKSAASGIGDAVDAARLTKGGITKGSSGWNMRRMGQKMKMSTNPLVRNFGRLTKASGSLLTKFGMFGSKIGGFFSKMGGAAKGLFSGAGKLAAGFGKILGPLAAVATGVQKGIETGSWLEGLKRGAVSAAIWGVGAVLAPVTGGASLIGAAALDITLGDKIADALPGGVKGDSSKDKTKELAKQTAKQSMNTLGITADAGFSDEQLERIATNTQKNQEFNESIKNMTHERLMQTRAELEDAKATPITMLSNHLAMNLMTMNNLVSLTEQGNADREHQTDALGPEQARGLGAMTVGAGR